MAIFEHICEDAHERDGHDHALKLKEIFHGSRVYNISFKQKEKRYTGSSCKGQSCFPGLLSC
jgi:hypothetical protein